MAYEKANRTNVKENIELLLKMLEEAEFNQEWINEYKQDMINYLKEKHKTNKTGKSLELHSNKNL